MKIFRTICRHQTTQYQNHAQPNHKLRDKTCALTKSRILIFDVMLRIVPYLSDVSNRTGKSKQKSLPKRLLIPAETLQLCRLAGMHVPVL